ncbi:MAG: sulfatase [Flavobacterium sp. MedPE-SWcel]|uniref:LTA synthase family protein n=1 Tax=uncultured Flavobacterium sp. TaxID=165435 RepID=UPI00091B30DE|nr:alkaline phosphatase family protein [uncultured Flavobacterium sp.]OIQ22073.1 MAG: sulfatase [Flavobacterium sp. MedPE-SWcel]
MNHVYRVQEYKALFYRLFLAYLFYFVARVLFFTYNSEFLEVDSIGEFMSLYYHGLAFDTTAILYMNLLFIFLSVIPIFINTKKGYQRVLFWVYFVFNLIAYATNFADFIYYKYTYARTTVAVVDVLKNEENKGGMFFRFLLTYWHVFALFLITASLWVYLYKKVKIKEVARTDGKLKYVLFSLLSFVFIGVMIVGGIRGDFKKSTRPINVIDANRHVEKVQHGDLVLNTPFAIIRTYGKTSFKKVDFVSQEVVQNNFVPVKQYANNPETKPNVVLIITESFGREYWGCMNQNKNIPGYVSYTPFLDSLAKHSLVFDNAFANGTKSIHGMSSILAGIPSFKDAFTSSPYPNQDIQSLVSILNEEGYDTSFFHGAPNGSMGFLGFGNILGYDHYYGKTEYNNDDDFDGSWGIWDEPFMQFMKDELDKKEGPFFGTVFTVSSHEPYMVPSQYEGKFPKGTIQIHQTVGYTDYAFKRFFEEAKKSPWFDNTIFVITADHGNQVAYDEYRRVINRQANPILIYKPDGSLTGIDSKLAQQIDIYPTVIDMIGYDKPFRSWGRSLIGDDKVEPYTISYINNNYIMQRGHYILTFDGKQATGFYDIEDKNLDNNLINKRNKEMNSLETACKAFLQDYFERIIDKKLNIKK